MDERREGGWEPCRLCRNPKCGQRPARNLPLLPFWKVERLVDQGILVATDREGVLLVERLDDLPRLKSSLDVG